VHIVIESCPIPLNHPVDIGEYKKEIFYVVMYLYLDRLEERSSIHFTSFRWSDRRAFVIQKFELRSNSGVFPYDDRLRRMIFIEKYLRRVRTQFGRTLTVVELWYL